MKQAEEHNTIRRDVAVINKLGLHARPSAMLVQLANGFKSNLFVTRDNGDEINAKSTMGVMMLAAAKGTILQFRAVGADAAELLDAVENLFKAKFNEE